MKIVQGYKEGENIPKGAKFVYAEKRKGKPYFDGQMNEKKDDVITFFYEIEVGIQTAEYQRELIEGEDM